MVCVCCVPAQQCCCDDEGIRILAVGEECANETFPVPDPAKTVELFFEWCGMTATEQLQGQVQSYFADEVIDEFVCDTTGRYGAEASFTQAVRKTLSVSFLAGGGVGNCGYEDSFIVSTGFEGAGFILLGGEYVPAETPITVENYDCTVYQCFDGSEAVVTMTMGPFGFTTDDTCGGVGNFDPCKFTTPTLTVVVAP